MNHYQNQNPYHYGALNQQGYYSHFYGNSQYLYPQVPPPSQLLAYGPYQEGPASQMIPPEWFNYVSPQIKPGNVPLTYLYPSYYPYYF